MLPFFEGIAVKGGEVGRVELVYFGRLNIAYLDLSEEPMDAQITSRKLGFYYR